MRSSPSNEGFTLVEVLVAATLSTLVFLVIHAILITSNRVAEAIGDERGLEAQTEGIVSRLRADVESGRIVAAAGSVLTVAGTVDTVTYAWNGAVPGTLVRSVGSDADTLSSEVSALAFTPRTFTYDTTIEAITTVAMPALGVSFMPGDWDDVVAAEPCVYLSRESFSVTGSNWIGVAFQSSLDISSFARARVLASTASAPDGDLMLEVYRAGSTPPYGPDLLLAQARINTATLTSIPEWITGTFVPIDSAPVPITTALWLVARARESYHALAAQLQIERLSCISTPAGALDNGIDSHTSTDGGATWTALPATSDVFAVLEATVDVEGLFETSDSRTDTTGVQITLSVTHDTTTEERVLEIAGIDL